MVVLKDTNGRSKIYLSDFLSGNFHYLEERKTFWEVKKIETFCDSNFLKKLKNNFTSLKFLNIQKTNVIYRYSKIL